MLFPKREQEFFLPNQSYFISESRQRFFPVYCYWAFWIFLPDLFYCYSEKDTHTHTHLSNQRYNEKRLVSESWGGQSIGPEPNLEFPCRADESCGVQSGDHPLHLTDPGLQPSSTWLHGFSSPQTAELRSVDTAWGKQLKGRPGLCGGRGPRTTAGLAGEAEGKTGGER